MGEDRTWMGEIFKKPPIGATNQQLNLSVAQTSYLSSFQLSRGDRKPVDRLIRKIQNSVILDESTLLK